MPQKKYYKGREVRSTRRVTIDGRVLVRIIFNEVRGQKGPREFVTEQEYKENMKIEYDKPLAS